MLLRTNDSKNGIGSYTLGNFKTLLLISNVYKTLCFSFEAFRAVQLIQQSAANLNCGYFKGVYFFLYTLYNFLPSNTDILLIFLVLYIVTAIIFVYFTFFIKFWIWLSLGFKTIGNQNLFLKTALLIDITCPRPKGSAKECDKIDLLGFIMA